MSKKLYITTAIPYVNGKPHIGNALDYLLADIWARYQRQTGASEVRFQVGTDEHGNKNAAKAKEMGLSPQAFADQGSNSFKELMTKMKASYTDFVRTTDAHHVGAVQYIWGQLKPYIYRGKYEGWYCDGCESFVTDREAAEAGGVCPDHGRPYKRLSEDNYFFRVGDFLPQIQKAIESDQLRIVPEFRKGEFLKLLSGGMPDVSISRPKKSLSWGVPVPDDPQQIMYVWIDALANYLTVLGYPDDPAWQDYWPADIQVIGKDILRFHAGIWPAMLMGLGLPLPKTLLVHGHVNVNGAKMSKSIGNVVDPGEVIDSYGLDAFRYYFSRHIPTTDDGDFSWDKFERAYNGELGNDLGNLVQRAAGMVSRYQSGVVGDIQLAEHDMFGFKEAMRELRFSDAMGEIWVLVQGVNKYIDRVKPWVIAKEAENNLDQKAHLEEVLAHTIGTIMQVANMIYPFLPDTSEKIGQIFGSGVIRWPSEGSLFPKIYRNSKANGETGTGTIAKEPGAN
jgi:methionyl-tRNA synthetase